MGARRVLAVSSARLTAHHRDGSKLLDCRAIFSVPGSVQNLIAGAGV